MLGSFFIFIAFISTIVCVYIYYSSYKNNIERVSAKYFYVISAIALSASTAILLYNILIHNFQIAYIYNYSSKELPFLLLISTLFAGQEGSFLFWALIISNLGLFLISKKNKSKVNSLAMSMYSFILLAFIILIIFNSPFKYIWDKYPDTFPYAFMPANGRSLNPILENFWMIIHPPFLFLGYSIAFIPFVLYVSNIISHSIKESINYIRKWQLLASAVLAIGIILGAVWAYESLGWGGWWGWDPIENSSLIPWIISVIIFHLLIIQNKYNAFVKTNFFLFFAQSILIIYSTFLTRTGILENSLHSFSGANQSTFYILIALIVLLFISCFYLFFKNKKSFNMIIQKAEIGYKSIDFYISSAMYLYLIISFFILIATSFPIINPNFSINPDFYNKVNIIPLILSILLLAVAYGFYYKTAFLKKNNIIIFTIILIISISAYIFLNINSLIDLIYISACILALASIIFALAKTKINKFTALTHLGLCLFFIAVIASGKYSKSTVVTLSNLETKHFNNLNISYIRSERFDHHLTDREKYRFIISIAENKDTVFAMPVMFIKNKQIYKEPAIEAGVFKDIYVSPIALDSIPLIENYYLNKNSKLKLKDSCEFTLIDFIPYSEDSTIIGTILKIQKDNSYQLDTFYTKIDYENNYFEPIWKYSELIFMNIGIIKIKDNTVQFALAKNEDLPMKKKEYFTFELSTEPLMSLLWISTFIIIISMIFLSMHYKRNHF